MEEYTNITSHNLQNVHIQGEQNVKNEKKIQTIVKNSPSFEININPNKYSVFEKLKDIPEIRPGKVQEAKQFIKDSEYPSENDLNKLSKIMLKNIIQDDKTQ